VLSGSEGDATSIPLPHRDTRYRGSRDAQTDLLDR